MKQQGSNQTAKFLEYEFEIFVNKAILKTKFSCNLYTSLKYQYDIPQSISPQVIAQNGVAQIHHLHKITMLLKYKETIVIPQYITINIGVRSKHRPLEKIVAGFVKLNISDYINRYQPLKIFRIQRCPDDEGMIELSIKSRKIRQICLSNNDSKLFKSKSIQSKVSLRSLHIKQKEQSKQQIALMKSHLNNRQSSTKLISNKSNQQLKIKKLLKKTLSQHEQYQNKQSFPNLKESLISNQNVDEIKKSVEQFSKQLNSDQQIKNNLIKVNKQLTNKFQKSEQQRREQEELRNAKQKIQTQKSTILFQTTSRTNFDKQLTSIHSGSTISTQKNHKATWEREIDAIQRNKQLLNALELLRGNITPSIQQLQLILQQQTQQYWQESSWKGLQILANVAQKFNIL